MALDKSVIDFLQAEFLEYTHIYRINSDKQEKTFIGYLKSIDTFGRFLVQKENGDQELLEFGKDKFTFIPPKATAINAHNVRYVSESEYLRAYYRSKVFGREYSKNLTNSQKESEHSGHINKDILSAELVAGQTVKGYLSESNLDIENEIKSFRRVIHNFLEALEVDIAFFRDSKTKRIAMTWQLRQLLDYILDNRYGVSNYVIKSDFDSISHMTLFHINQLLVDAIDAVPPEIQAESTKEARIDQLFNFWDNNYIVLINPKKYRNRTVDRIISCAWDAVNASGYSARPGAYHKESEDILWGTVVDTIYYNLYAEGLLMGIQKKTDANNYSFERTVLTRVD